jgi:hypothetical protein
MRRELYMVRNETVKGRISTRRFDGVVRDQQFAMLQKVTEIGLKSMENAKIAAS